jgi:sugar transferase (PEP-CTERM/EpsH1 system associated)
MKLALSSENLLSANAVAMSARSVGHGQSLRILHVINRLDMGGAEFGIVKVIAGLGNQNFEHQVCAIRGFQSGLANLPELRGNVVTAGSREKGFEFLLFRLARIMRAFKPHIVHSRNWGAIEAIPAARLAGVPVAVHSDHGYELEMLAGLPLRQRLLRRAAYWMADTVFTVTKDLRDYHEQQAGVSSKRIRVIRNGVDTARFAPRPEIRLDIRKKFDLPAESFVIGTVGRAVPIKDHATLLKAARVLARRDVDVRVLLAGSGPELAALQDFVKACPELAGRVTFLGACENIPEVLNALDVFVLPSISEGMSNTLLEAMASGLPVVATRVGGSPELVEEGRSGWLFTPANVAELAGRLEQLERPDNLRRQMGEASRRRAVAEFSLERMIADYRNLYQELAAKRGILAGSKA